MEFTRLRQQLLAKYPELKKRRRYPWLAAWFPALTGLIVTASWLIVRLLGGGHVAAALLVSFGLGWLYASYGLFTHELLHGSILKNKTLCHILAWPGFFLFGLSPELWLTWHNRVHHYNTNASGADPDTFGLWSEFRELPMNGFVLKRAPGSGHLLSWLYLPINFNNQTLTVMWFFLWKGDRKLYGSANRPLAVAETLASYALWFGVFWFLGWKAGLLLLFFPMLIANLIVSAYILVQHLFCPLTATNEPLENTLGVTTNALFDWLHFRFGHHVEHHIFPELNHRDFPALRAKLKADYPKQYRCLPHSKALRILLSGPRVYRDANTLFDPHGGRRLDVSRIGR